MQFDDLFRPVAEVPSYRAGEEKVVGALNLLAASGETKVEVVDLLGMSPKTWSEKCRGRGWAWSQRKDPDVRDLSGHLIRGDPHYFIEIR
jgi:hypothetical protein